jgi:hypothetical protein
MFLLVEVVFILDTMVAMAKTLMIFLVQMSDGDL